MRPEDAKKNSDLFTQDFTESKDNYSLTQRGETYNLYQHIQDAREDTEVIPTLEKYGMAKGLEKLKKYDESRIQEYMGDFHELGNMRNLMDKAKKAEEMWWNMPSEVREEFGNSPREFIDKGHKWAETKYNEWLAKQPKQTEQPKESEVENG